MLKIEYRTQRLSLRFFLLMLVLFFFQTAFGLLLAAQHIDPSLLAGTLNFNVARAEHTNLGILWVLSGFIGTILFVGPLLSRRELAAPWLIKLLFYALLAVVIWNVATQTLAQQGIAGWWAGQPMLQEGLEYLEAGRIADVVILIGFAILCWVVLRSFPPISQWNEIHWGLGLGVVALTLVWIFGMFFVDRLDLQEYFRWYVVHYWVEGVWEVIHIALVGFLLVLMFRADVKTVGYAVFWGISLVWLSGLLGNAHHYFWIGTPEFWQFWGSLFSALEPLPLIFCFWHLYLDAHQDRRPIENMPAFAFLLGSVVMEQVGAGILGFTMTFALTNVWSHGTWVTLSHAHLALFGTFGMLGLSAAYYAVPIMRGMRDFDQRPGRLAFWLAFTGMLGLAFAFAIGGTVQVFVYRTLGLDWFGGDVAPAMLFAKAMVPIFGLLFAAGVCLVTYDLLTLGVRQRLAEGEAAPTNEPPRATGWGRPLGGWETGSWVLAMWIFGGLITLGLLSFNLATVQEGRPLLPYVMGGTGYPGLLLVTLFFVHRFLRSLDARRHDVEPSVRA
ncbi:MAG TPA: cbb3-type cytochrome c oxidase subunit I [Rubrivivax sp.]|nr:cbb3-type cytochrome c oxidase subunit I [Rubrivivax sp.]